MYHNIELTTHLTPLWRNNHLSVRCMVNVDSIVSATIPYVSQLSSSSLPRSRCTTKLKTPCN